jgi:predicted amidohydrolase
MDTAARAKVWVVLGSIHRLTPPHKPHNCLYLIGPDGKIKDRYDKRFCLKSELAFYSPGDHFVTFTLRGVTCALLICFDVRFPELYRELYKLKVQCILQSFYNARQQGPSIHSDIMVQSMQCRAASNAFWVSMCNSSARYCPYGSCFIRPDGKVIQRLARHRTGMMIHTVDMTQSFYDPMQGFRELAISGQFNNDRPPAQDPRSRDRTIL